MCFFNTKQNQDLSEQWRKKYLNLFDEQNKIEHENQEKQRLLRQFIIQISILCEGSDKNLDPILLNARNHVKNEVDVTTLKNELKIFNESVKNLPPKKKKLEADLLFDFLIRQYPDPVQQAALRELKGLVNSEERTAEQLTDLFIEITNIIEPEIALELEVNEDKNIASDVVLVDVRMVTQQLLQYVSSLPIPAVFEAQTAAVKNALLNPEQSLQAFEEVLNDLIELLLKIKEFSEAEQQDIDQFLIHVATQLSELNTIVTETNTTANDTTKNRNKLDQAVFTQIRELQVQAIKTTSLDSLKGMVDECFKTIAADLKSHHQQDKEQQQKFQDSMAEMLNKMIELEVETEALKKELKVVHTQASLDTLTGLFNRNAYNQRLRDEFARYKRYGSPFALAIWDIDYFKKINDTFGHKAGDKVLVLTAQQLQEHTRDTDFIGRFGGEEFVMLLSSTSKEAGLGLADQLRELISKTGFNANGKSVPITISCGITEINEDDTEETLFERADKALYEAKNKGRNQCCVL